MPSSDEEGGEAVRREKSRKSVPFIVNSCISKAFLSLTLRELPRQREPQVCKPLRLITGFTTSKVPTPGGQGRPPLQNRVCKQSDKLILVGIKKDEAFLGASSFSVRVSVCYFSIFNCQLEKYAFALSE